MADDSEELIDQLLADFLAKREAGEPVVLQELMTEYPELADQIREFFVDNQQVQDLASPITIAASPPWAIRSPVCDLGDYEVLEEIARGGMGVVYKAHQRKLNRVVALKMILSGEFAGEAEKQRFRSEAEAVAQLKHPHIVPVYDVGEVEGRPFLAMGFVEGQSLKQRISQGPMDSYEISRVISLVANAVQYAHDQGIIHRDLKPANILLDNRRQPHVTDFGLAKRIDTPSDLTGTGQILGTPNYMPPEQAAGTSGRVAPTSDVYALGATMYHLLTGSVPFQADSVMETLAQVMECEPIPPRQAQSLIPTELEAICLKCMRKDPGERYPSARELAKDLQRFEDGVPVLAHGEGAWSRAKREVLRKSRHGAVLARCCRTWRWQAVISLIVFAIINGMVWWEVQSSMPYLIMAFVGVAGLALPVWLFRFRLGEPLTLLERRIGPIWISFAGMTLLSGLIGYRLGLSPLQVLPFVVLECAMGMVAMASILGGTFYPMAGACVVVAMIMAFIPTIGPILTGISIAAGLWTMSWTYSDSKNQS